MSDVVGVWLQDWTGQRVFGENGGRDLPRVGLWWNWEVDESHYQNWTGLISELASRGIKVLTYINPLLSNVSQRETPYRHNYYREALEEGFAVRNGDGTVWTGYSDSLLVDLSNPSAYQWMKNMIVNNMLATGVCGWMCDFGETVPATGKTSQWGRSPRLPLSLPRDMGPT
ncbi:Sulfoquinovosidase [Geodia barretti]|nr:Sulfoquinovosidase [Geodia barretti]